VALVRLARLFASADGAVACGRFDELRSFVGRISEALTLARSSEKNAPADLSQTFNGLRATVAARR
jgi:hypothetical protein